MKKVEEKRVDVNAAVGMGEVILGACHPDCITTIKHWITIIRARFEEVSPAGLVPGWWWFQGCPRSGGSCSRFPILGGHPVFPTGSHVGKAAPAETGVGALRAGGQCRASGGAPGLDPVG